MNPEDIKVGERSQAKKGNRCMLPFPSQSIETEGRMEALAAGGYQEKGNEVFNGDRVSVWADEKVREMDAGDSCTTV